MLFPPCLTFFYMIAWLHFYIFTFFSSLQFLSTRTQVPPWFLLGSSLVPPWSLLNSSLIHPYFLKPRANDAHTMR